MARVAALVALLALAAIPACAPADTTATVSAEAGRTAAVTYGTVIAVRPVTIRGGRRASGSAGAGTATGAGDWHASLLAGLGGAIPGGLVGTATGAGAAGSAVEFVVREDSGGDVQVVQANEDGLAVGERVAVIRSARTRLTRAAGSASRLSAAPLSPAVAAPAGMPRRASRAVTT